MLECLGHKPCRILSGSRFGAAFATRYTWATFLVGLAAAVGAGISMAGILIGSS